MTDVSHDIEHVEKRLAVKKRALAYCVDRSEDLDGRVKELRHTISELEATLAELRRPVDTYGDGTVLQFVHIYRGSHPYEFAAIKAEGWWYLTGRVTAAWSWKDLLDFVGNEPLYRATRFEPIN